MCLARQGHEENGWKTRAGHDAGRGRDDRIFARDGFDRVE